MGINVTISKTPQFGVSVSSVSQQTVSSSTVFLGASDVSEVANLALEQSNTALIIANNALIVASDISGKANLALEQSNTALSVANSAYQEANNIINGVEPLTIVDAGTY
jgi:hypothetical protein